MKPKLFIPLCVILPGFAVLSLPFRDRINRLFIQELNGVSRPVISGVQERSAFNTCRLVSGLLVVWSLKSAV